MACRGLAGNYYLDEHRHRLRSRIPFMGGSPATTGVSGSWTYIGAEQVSGGGYDVALHLPGSDQYTVWNTDNTGNVDSNLNGGIVSGNEATQWNLLEPIFHQDLNGDGTIGIAPIIISGLRPDRARAGRQQLFPQPGRRRDGPEFKYAGTPVTVGEFGAWTFIGVGQLTGGYDIALHLPGSDQYTVWGIDSSGNVISNATGGIVSGTSSALESPRAYLSIKGLNGDVDSPAFRRR